jgi:hypothetical protein
MQDEAVLGHLSKAVASSVKRRIKQVQKETKDLRDKLLILI